MVKYELKLIFSKSQDHQQNQGGYNQSYAIHKPYFLYFWDFDVQNFSLVVKF